MNIWFLEYSTKSNQVLDIVLSLQIKRRNLVCQILGGDSLFFPMFADDDADSMSSTSPSFAVAPTTEVSRSHLDESILVHIRDLILNAQEYGCWKEGVGGIGQVSWSYFACFWSATRATAPSNTMKLVAFHLSFIQRLPPIATLHLCYRVYLFLLF
jgi:hypothetical protein